MADLRMLIAERYFDDNGNGPTGKFVLRNEPKIIGWLEGLIDASKLNKNNQSLIEDTQALLEMLGKSPAGLALWIAEPEDDEEK